MVVELEMAPKTQRAMGERCCEPVVYPDVERERAPRMAEVAKALGDPIRLQLVEVLRKHAGQRCVCELVPPFDISQPMLSHHLKKLRDAGVGRLRAPRSVGVLLRQTGRARRAVRLPALSCARGPVPARLTATAATIASDSHGPRSRIAEPACPGGRAEPRSRGWRSGQAFYGQHVARSATRRASAGDATVVRCELRAGFVPLRSAAMTYSASGPAPRSVAEAMLRWCGKPT
jgi:ArsR family transcriptional regulator